MLNLQTCSFQRRILSILFSFLLLLFFCLGMTSCRKSNPEATVQLWVSEDNPLYSSLTAAVGEYNRQIRSGDLLSVSLRSFTDEETMIAAFSSGSPDLLLCSHYRQDALEQMDLLLDIAPAADMQHVGFTEDITARFSACGHSFFPIGSNILLLLFSDSVYASDSDSSVSALFSAAQKYSSESGRPYFTADSFSALFCQLLLSEKQEFHASLSVDLRMPVFSSLWNDVAALAYDGALISASANGASLVRAGVLPCSVISSETAAGMTSGSISVFPGTENAHVSDCFGIVSICHASRTRSAGAFLHWLFDADRSVLVALRAGLIPAVTGAYSGNSSLEQLLVSLESSSSGFFPALSSDYHKNSSSFERYFRSIVSYLY